MFPASALDGVEAALANIASLLMVRVCRTRQSSHVQRDLRRLRSAGAFFADIAASNGEPVIEVATVSATDSCGLQASGRDADDAGS